jgi:hypothetical protein
MRRLVSLSMRSRILNLIFPKIDTEASARKAALQGVIAAAIVATYALVTTVFALELENAVDCLLYAIVSWRIYKMSRPWALLGLFSVLAEATSIATTTRAIWTVPLFVLVIPFLNAIRGTFIFCRERKRADDNSGGGAWSGVFRLSNVLRMAIGIVAVAAISSGVYLARLASEDNANIDKAENSVKLWDRDACLAQTFPVFRNTKVMKQVGSDAMGQLRILSAKMYCARQWDPAKFATGAALLESNGLLLSQTDLARRTAEQFGKGPEVMYSQFPKEVADFLKVFDSGVFLRPSMEEIEKRRKTDPTIPDLETIRKVRSELLIDSLWTLPSQLPQEYQVSSGPEIKLVTNVGLDTTLWQLWNNSQVDVFFAQRQRALFSKLTLQPASDNTNPYAEQIVNMLRLSLRWGRDLRFRFEAEPLDDLDPLPSLTILFLPRSFLPQLPTDRVAAYVPNKILMAATPETIPIMPNSDDKTDPHLLAGRLTPAPLNHEFHHYLFFRKAVASSGFILEGEATANGEYMSQMIYEGALANPKNTNDQLEQMTLDLFKAESLTPTNFDWVLYNKLGLEREQSSPFTNVQCRLLTVLHNSYPDKTKPLPLAAQLTLDPKLFQSQAQDLELAYAEAWAVYHVEITQNQPFHDKLERIFPKAQQAGAAALTALDRKDLDEISKITLDWVSRAASSTHSGCNASNSAGRLSGSVD